MQAAVQRPGDTGRFHALDGLRGIAALVIVVHHAAMTSPLVTAGPDRPAAVAGVDPATAAWLVPAQATLWLGPAAVAVFFVLSGFVLALPGAAPEPLRRAPAFWVRRLLRLYPPVWAAVLFAYALALAVPRVAAPGQSWWTAVHAAPVTLDAVVTDLVVVRGVTWANSPLWTLRWEILFSLVLPLVLPVLRALGRRPVGAVAVVVALLVAVALGRATGSNALHYLPMFGVGIVLAGHHGRLRGDSRPAFATVLVVALVLLGAGAVVDGPTPVTDALAVAGAGGLVVAMLSARAAGFGRVRLVRTLAAWSFGLYLVHEPLVITATTLVPALTPPVLLAVVLPPALLLAWALHRGAELPAAAVAARAGRRVARGVRGGRGGRGGRPAVVPAVAGRP